MRTEAPVQIALEDEGKVLRGRIDVLVLQNRFWVLVVESRSRIFPQGSNFSGSGIYDRQSLPRRTQLWIDNEWQ